MRRTRPIRNHENPRRRRAGRLASGIAFSMLFAVAGCVAANDVTGESVPSSSVEIEDLDRARSLGAIDEADYLRLRRSFILAD
ncbi:MAG: hypothetical protein GY921_13200 [Phycisphaeraceae bacterium]|nr:hypothetical protein [Phycisphaeraceae bacterium]HAC09400.1 hypothetical protein [Phycisphaerales bacterium]MCP4068775.1 hypothetical protein [Phycisphaeraceae bacterium]MCP4497746.1 hypothetical protein [Phycisphaeraceae bacterium]MCP4796299.1 hypothetical protein [Phycisphaeraceae bacterium]|tara:strand:+ start:87 stop:335 length:249 start_codon:yes stop_codon:yes gene_type:complete